MKNTKSSSLSGLGLDILLTSESEPEENVKDDEDNRDATDFLELETREDSEEEVRSSLHLLSQPYILTLINVLGCRLIFGPFCQYC